MNEKLSSGFLTRVKSIDEIISRALIALDFFYAFGLIRFLFVVKPSKSIRLNARDVTLRDFCGCRIFVRTQVRNTTSFVFALLQQQRFVMATKCYCCMRKNCKFLFIEFGITAH